MGLLAAAQAELRHEEAAWQRDRVGRWHAFCADEMAGGGRRLFR